MIIPTLPRSPGPGKFSAVAAVTAFGAEALNSVYVDALVLWNVHRHAASAMHRYNGQLTCVPRLRETLPRRGHIFKLISGVLGGPSHSRPF